MFSLYNGKRGCAANLDMVFQHLWYCSSQSCVIDLGRFSIDLVIQLPSLVLIWVGNFVFESIHREPLVWFRVCFFCVLLSMFSGYCLKISAAHSHPKSRSYPTGEKVL